MGHKDYKTTEIYADYAPSPHESELVERAFSQPVAEEPAATRYGSRRTSWVPIRRQTTCASLSRFAGPYANVARPSAAKVISQTPRAP